MSKIIHISQPRIYPHITYFDNMKYVDLFVVSDDLIVNKSSYEIRNKYFCKLSNSPKYLNVPIEEKVQFKDLVISDINYAAKHREIIKHSYSKYKFFDEYLLEALIPDAKSKWFIEQWMRTFDNLRKMLEIDIKLDFASNANSNSYKVGRIEEIFKFYKGTSYVSGQGSSDYIDSMKIDFRINKPNQENYQYRDESTYYMIADMIFSIGLDETIRRLHKKQKQ